MTMTRLMIQKAIRRFLVGEDGIAGSALIEFTVIAPRVLFPQRFDGIKLGIGGKGGGWSP
jgi:hypothetical protein